MDEGGPLWKTSSDERLKQRTDCQRFEDLRQRMKAAVSDSEMRRLPTEEFVMRIQQLASRLHYLGARLLAEYREDR